MKSSKLFTDTSTPPVLYLRPADIVVTGAPKADESSWISKVIKNSTRTVGESPTLFSHAGIIGRGGAFHEATIIEMTWPKMREVSLARNYGKASIRVWRLNDLTYPQARTIARAARSWKKHPWKKWYGLEKLPMFFLDSVVSKVVSFLMHRPVEFRLFSTFNLTRRLVCSQVVSRLFQIYAGVSFSMSDSSLEAVTRLFGRKLVAYLHAYTHLKLASDGPGVTPDDIDDYCLAHKNDFSCMYSQLSSRQ